LRLQEWLHVLSFDTHEKVEGCRWKRIKFEGDYKKEGWVQQPILFSLN